MKTPASILKHPLHPMLVAVPIGLWVFSLACDFIFRSPLRDPVWVIAAQFSLVGGIIGAVFAAIPGLIDFFSLKAPKVKGIAVAHMTLNTAALVIYIINALMRGFGNPAGQVPFILSIVGIGLITAGGWLGAEMVYVHRIGVNTPEEKKAKETVHLIEPEAPRHAA